EGQARATAFHEALARADERMEALAAGLKDKQSLLPPRLASALERPLRRIESTDTPTGERAQLLSTVLNRWLEFDATITEAEEIHTIDGERRHLHVIYLGTAQAFSLDRANDRASLGRPGDDGWEWIALPDAAAPVAQALAVARDEADPRFVVLQGRLGQR